MTAHDKETFDLAKKELRGLTYGKIFTMIVCCVTSLAFIGDKAGKVIQAMERMDATNNIQNLNIANIAESNNQNAAEIKAQAKRIEANEYDIAILKYSKN